jgi:Uma2 family endonuclease
MTTAELAIPEPPLDLLDEKYLEYLDRQWIKKESVGRKKHEDVTEAVYNLLNRYRHLIGGELAEHWTIILGPDKAEPDVTLSHPVYNLYQGYLVSPAFLVAEVRSYGQTLPYLVKKCKDRYHRAGISYCWIIDADSQAGYECHREGPHPQQADILTAGPVIEVPVPEIFEEAAKL